MNRNIDRLIIFVALCICVYSFVTHAEDMQKSLESIGNVIDAQSRLIEDIRHPKEPVSSTEEQPFKKNKIPFSVNKDSDFKNMTTAELEHLANREEVSVIGLTGVTVEKILRQDSESAKKELERRKNEN